MREMKLGVEVVGGNGRGGRVGDDYQHESSGFLEIGWGMQKRLLTFSEPGV
jgi:hypothetical protein